jgi:hypothetical protein
MLPIARVAAGFLGLGMVALGASSLSKLTHDHLDSPRWMFVVAGGVSLAIGGVFLWLAVRGLRRSRSSTL